MKRKTAPDSNRVSLVLLLLTLTILASCQNEDTDLPFASIAQAESFRNGHDYSGADPELLILTSAKDVDAPGADVQFNSVLADQLRAINYETHFVVIVFRGQLGGQNPSYAIDILGISRRGDQVVVKTHFGELGPDQGSLMAFSSYYHAVSIAKEGQWAQRIDFVLKEDGKTVKEKKHFIP